MRCSKPAACVSLPPGQLRFLSRPTFLFVAKFLGWIGETNEDQRQLHITCLALRKESALTKQATSFEEPVADKCSFANKLDFVGDKREYSLLSLLPWCLSVPEISNTGPISGEVRRRNCHK
jgi:hypothetical protein